LRLEADVQQVRVWIEPGLFVGPVLFVIFPRITRNC
jgi:hypothetical protein